MKDNEQFTCQGCGQSGHISYLCHRLTETGNFCPVCAEVETCGACGDQYPKAMGSVMHDVGNWICDDCKHDYKDVAQYIKRIFSVRVEVKSENKKAA